MPNSIIRAFIEEAKRGVNDRKGSITGDFGTSFFAEVCNSFPDSNVLVSPFVSSRELFRRRNIVSCVVRSV